MVFVMGIKGWAGLSEESRAEQGERYPASERPMAGLSAGIEGH